ncbi:hypothetical protein HFN86_35740 [Rhizobium laguerreae]|uniref:hypothetical protein n=1 Tax=Rhizobium laguerreae TaxID=1076926 RepID=UPI001C90D73A|nr:hypothetical protein [Rhizobium laguerreae]MBY3425466.1 hypothetical protein [Rhizobium laguerreae]
MNSNVEAMTVDDFLDRLEAVPEEHWGPDTLSGPRQCVMAILGVSPGVNADASPLAKQLLDVTGDIEFVRYWKLVNKKGLISGLEAFRSIPRVVRVNRGEDPGYRQPTSKQRVLAYLRDVNVEIRKLDARVNEVSHTLTD